MKNVAKRFIADESGATAIEYGMICAFMGIAVVAIFTAFKTQLTTAFSTLGTSLNTQAAKLGTTNAQ